MLIVGGQGLAGDGAGQQLSQSLGAEIDLAITELEERMEAAFGAAEARLNGFKTHASTVADAIVASAKQAAQELRTSFGAFAPANNDLEVAHDGGKAAFNEAVAVRGQAATDLAEAAADLIQESDAHSQAVGAKAAALATDVGALVIGLAAARAAAVDLNAKVSTLLIGVAGEGQQELRRTAGALDQLLTLTQQLLSELDLTVADKAFGVLQRAADGASTSMSTMVNSAGEAGLVLKAVSELTGSLQSGVLGQAADVVRQLESIRAIIQQIRVVLDMVEKLT